MECNVCTSRNVNQILSLPNYPLNSIYLTSDETSKIEKYAPKDFSVYICDACKHFQAISAIQLSELYNDEYNYNTQNSGVQGRIEFFLSQLKQIEKIKYNRVIDIGCYDLSLLKSVKKKIEANYFIGIDPSIPSKCLTNHNNIICFKDYIDNVDIPYYNKGLPDLIISDQTFEHIPTINSTIENIVNQVSENSVFAICVPSLEVLIEKLNFHNLIHEHVNYFSVNTLSKLFAINKVSLKSYALNYTSTCGFLFGIFVKNNIEIDTITIETTPITHEYFFKYYNLFMRTMDNTKQIINDLRNEKVYGFGASDITPNLAYFMNSDFSFIDKIIDDTKYKQNKFLPFLKPEIIDQSVVDDDLNDSICFITAPQAARYIYPRLSANNFKKIINPIGVIA